MLLTLSLAALALAAVPALLFRLNVRLYLPPPPFPPAVEGKPLRAVSVLIPARNEELDLQRSVAGMLARNKVISDQFGSAVSGMFEAIRHDLEGQTQSWVAAQFGINQATVSRIVQRYERWQAHAQEREGGRLDRSERLRAQRWLTSSPVKSRPRSKRWAPRCSRSRRVWCGRLG